MATQRLTPEQAGIVMREDYEREGGAWADSGPCNRVGCCGTVSPDDGAHRGYQFVCTDCDAEDFDNDDEEVFVCSECERWSDEAMFVDSYGDDVCAECIARANALTALVALVRGNPEALVGTLAKAAERARSHRLLTAVLVMNAQLYPVADAAEAAE